MSGYQVTLSIIRLLAVAIGLWVLVQKLVSETAPVAWGLFCILFCSLLVMHRVIDRLPMSHEAIFRVANTKQWSELSEFQRHGLMLFDLPLFRALRDREHQRLSTEPLFRFTYDRNCIVLQSVTGQQIERYILREIARCAAPYGVRNEKADKDFNIFRQKRTPELRLAADDGRIIHYVGEKFDSGGLISARSFGMALEAAYIMTLPDKGRIPYMWAMR